MFMQIAIGAIGIGVVLMVGYLVIAQVRTALPSPQASYNNSCYGVANLSDTTYCNTTSVDCGPLTDNASTSVTCTEIGFAAGTASVQATVFAGFGLIAVGIIVLAAFGLINIFQ